MRDIVRDAAIIAVAEKVRKYMSVQTFLAQYTKNNKDVRYVKQILAQCYLTSYVYNGESSITEDRYTLTWSEE